MRKIFFAACAVIVAVMIFFGIMFRINAKDGGLYGVKNVADLPKETITLEYAYPKGRITEEDLLSDDGKTYAAEETEFIARVSPTGVMDQSAASLGQEAVVEEVFKGDETLVGKTVWIYIAYGFSIMEFDDVGDLTEEEQELNGKFLFRNAMNIMYPEYEYLVFLNPSELNEYQSMYVLVEDIYNTGADYLKIIRADEHDTETLPEEFENIYFEDLKEYEFFSIDEEVTQVLNEARKNLREKYS